MAKPQPPVLPRIGKIIWPAVAFMASATIVLIGVSLWYLIPALDAYNHADANGRRILAVHALLVLSVLLCLMALMLLLTFRVGRFFLPRSRSPRTQTKYVDAWAESARRMPTPPEDES